MALARAKFAAIAIEGVGDEGDVSGGVQSDGWLITTSSASRHADVIEAATDWAVKPWLLLDSLQVQGVKTEIFQAGIYWPTFSGAMQAVDEAAERFVWTQFRAQTTLEERITASDTTIKLDRADLAGHIIYIGDETIRLGSATGTSGGVTTYDVATGGRGYYTSEARGHEAEATVFTRTPYFDARRARLYTGELIGSTVDLEQRGQGLLVGNVIQDRGRLMFNTREAGARLKEVKGGKKDRRISDDGWLEYKNLNRGNENGAIGGSTYLYDNRIVKPEADDTGVFFDACVQVGEYAFRADLEFDTSTPNGFFEVSVSGTPLFGKTAQKEDFEGEDIEGSTGKRLDDPAFEIFGVDRFKNVSPLHRIAEALGEVFRWHKLTYYAAFHLSTRQTSADPSSFDVLQPGWSLNASWMFVDSIVDDIKTLVRQTSDLVVDRIAIGADNEAVDLRAFCIRELLHPHFCESIGPDGKLTIERVRTPTISDHDGALGRPVKPLHSETLTLDPARDRVKSSIQATLGDTELTEGRSAFVETSANTQQRRNDYDNGRELTVDWSTVDPVRRAGTLNRGGSVEDRVSYVVDTLIDQLQLQSYPNQRLTFLAEDQKSLTADYRTMEFVNLGDLDLEPEWIVDNDGNRVSNFSEIEATGMVVGRQFHLTDQQRSTGYTLTVLFVGDGLTRWRSPSGKIQGVEPDGFSTILTLEGDDGSPSQFGATDDNGDPVPDVAFFTVGDEVNIHTPSGAYWSNWAILTVVAIDENAHTITVNGSWSPDPPVGHFVELAYPDTDGVGGGYTNNGLNGTFENIDRAYIALADDDDTIGDAGLDADQWGA